MTTAEIADDYDDSLNFGRAVVYAPAPNMAANVDSLDDLAPLDQTFYSTMLVGLKTQHPELNYSDYLGAHAPKMLPTVRSACFDDLAAQFD